MVSESDLCCTADLLLFTPYISVLVPGFLRVTGTPQLFLAVQTLFCLILQSGNSFISFFFTYYQLASHASVRKFQLLSANRVAFYIATWSVLDQVC